VVDNNLVGDEFAQLSEGAQTQALRSAWANSSVGRAEILALQ
jgi:hypothetical protein